MVMEQTLPVVLDQVAFLQNYKLYKTQKMAANQVNFMKLIWFSTLNFSNF